MLLIVATSIPLAVLGLLWGLLFDSLGHVYLYCVTLFVVGVIGLFIGTRLRAMQVQCSIIVMVIAVLPLLGNLLILLTRILKCFNIRRLKLLSESSLGNNLRPATYLPSPAGLCAVSVQRSFDIKSNAKQQKATGENRG